jgi:diguanylate cyclase (GGDEF)-like protein
MPDAGACDAEAAKSAIDQLFGYLRDLIYNPSEARLDVAGLPMEFNNLAKGLVYFAECLAEAGALAKDMSRGELNGQTASRGNEIAAPLKSLQASLKHLTWQTKQVAKGDYKQRVSFMGEFADSFNMMIEQLDARSEAILREMEENRKKSEALSQNNALLEAITENIPQWIVVVGMGSAEWLYVNRDIAEIVSSPNAREDLRGWLWGRMKEPPSGYTMQADEIELRDDSGSQYFSVVIHPIHWYERDAVAFVFTDVTSEKRQLHKLETAAYYDPLTKSFNRHYGMELLAKWLAGGIRFLICFVDMDNLKYVNDKYGHSEGDNYILKVVGILRMFSDDAVICRLGGDEFMLLSRGEKAEDAEAKLESLRDELLKIGRRPDNRYNHSISYGVVLAEPGETMSASELLGVADEKMYKYKREHKMQRSQTSAEAPMLS